ncbi:interleukin-1 receptor antagonist protein-like isoform X2 [Ambystoma mexicanum]
MKPSLTATCTGPCQGDCAGCKVDIQVKMTVPKQPSAFRRAVVLVVAVEKMKRGLLDKCLFRDSDLLEILGSILVEDDIPVQTAESTCMAELMYHHFSKSVYQITDTANKSMALQQFSGQAQLVALHLQGPNIDLQVKLSMAFYKSPPTADIRKRPVTLGIVGRKLYLSCMMVGDQPELRLEEVNTMLTPIKTDLLRFLFFKVDRASSSNPSCTFESAACPRWFISTSQNENEPVTVRNYEDQRAIQTFKLFQQ